MPPPSTVKSTSNAPQGLHRIFTDQIIPTLSASWPSHQGPQHPHDCLAIRGWHSFACRGYWDVAAIMRDFANSLHFSERYGSANADANPQNELATLTFAPCADVVAIVNQPITGTTFLLTVWAPSPDIAKREFVALREGYRRKLKRKRGGSNFAVITISHGALGTRIIELKPVLRNDEDVQLHYGSEFVAWQSHFITQLKKRSCGVTILRGEPGTGKTTFLKYLTRKLRQTHRFYYLPLPVFPWLSNPAAVDFWLAENEVFRRARKIVILEDAESLLMQRAPDNQESVSNLLNISDGFLGDVLKLHIICTINCEIGKLDSALLRPGRLVAIREFDKLTKDQALALATLKSVPINTQRDYSLAEIYNATDGASINTRSMGFASTDPAW